MGDYVLDKNYFLEPFPV